MASVIAACIDRPDCVLDEAQMTDLLVDVHQAEGLLDLQSQQGLHGPDNDRYQQQVIAAVLQKHGITRAQYDSSLMWYAQHLKQLTRVYGHVDERLNEMHDAWSLQDLESRDFGISAQGDSVELWTLTRHLVLDARRHSDVHFWTIPTDSNYQAGDTLRWRFGVRQLLQSQRLVASVTLTAAPETSDPLPHKTVGGEPQKPLMVGFANVTMQTDGDVVLTVFSDSLQSFGSALLGLVLMQDSGASAPVFVDSISLMRTHVTSSR